MEHWHALQMHGRKKSTPFGLALPDVPHPKGSVLLNTGFEKQPNHVDPGDAIRQAVRSTTGVKQRHDMSNFTGCS